MLDRDVVQIFYDHCQHVLATLHDEQVLVLSELRLSPTRERFEHRVLRRLAVPEGFRLCPKSLVAGQVVLHKNWDMTFGKRKLRRTQLMFVDVETGKKQYKFVPNCDMKQSVGDGTRMFVADKTENCTRIFKFQV